MLRCHAARLFLVVLVISAASATEKKAYNAGLLAGHSCTGQSVQLAAQDCFAFQALYDATGGSSWAHCSASARNDPCACTYSDAKAHSLVASTSSTHLNARVVCEYDGHDRTRLRVVSVGLSHNNLHGQLSHVAAGAFGNFSAVRYFDLGHNHMSGSIPASIGHMAALRGLILDRNALTGSIPASLPFSRYTNGCRLRDTSSPHLGKPTNSFACPLPRAALRHCTGTSSASFQNVVPRRRCGGSRRCVLTTTSPAVSCTRKPVTALEETRGKSSAW